MPQFTEDFNNSNKYVVDPTSGLIGYWVFNEGTGLTVADQTANGNTITLTSGSFTWMEGKSGSAVGNPGSTKGATSSNPAVFRLSGGQSKSISFWIYFSGSYPNLNRGGVVFANANLGFNEGNHGYSFYIDTTGKPAFWMTSAGASGVGNDPAKEETKFCTQAVGLNRWTHVTIVYTASSKQVHFYINGNYINSEIFTNAEAYNHPATMGGANWFGEDGLDGGGEAGTNNSEQPLKGFLDEMRFYNRMLTAEEVRNIYEFNYTAGNGLDKAQISNGFLHLQFNSSTGKYEEIGDAETQTNLSNADAYISNVTFIPSGVNLPWNVKKTFNVLSEWNQSAVFKNYVPDWVSIASGGFKPDHLTRPDHAGNKANLLNLVFDIDNTHYTVTGQKLGQILPFIGSTGFNSAGVWPHLISTKTVTFTPWKDLSFESGTGLVWEITNYSGAGTGGNAPSSEKRNDGPIDGNEYYYFIRTMSSTNPSGWTSLRYKGTGDFWSPVKYLSEIKVYVKNYNNNNYTLEVIQGTGNAINGDGSSSSHTLVIGSVLLPASENGTWQEKTIPINPVVSTNAPSGFQLRFRHNSNALTELPEHEFGVDHLQIKFGRSYDNGTVPDVDAGPRGAIHVSGTYNLLEPARKFSVIATVSPAHIVMHRLHPHDSQNATVTSVTTSVNKTFDFYPIIHSSGGMAPAFTFGYDWSFAWSKDTYYNRSNSNVTVEFNFAGESSKGYNNGVIYYQNPSNSVSFTNTLKGWRGNVELYNKSIKFLNLTYPKIMSYWAGLNYAQQVSGNATTMDVVGGKSLSTVFKLADDKYLRFFKNNLTGAMHYKMIITSGNTPINYDFSSGTLGPLFGDNSQPPWFHGQLHQIPFAFNHSGKLTFFPVHFVGPFSYQKEYARYTATVDTPTQPSDWNVSLTGRQAQDEATESFIAPGSGKTYYGALESSWGDLHITDDTATAWDQYVKQYTYRYNHVDSPHEICFTKGGNFDMITDGNDVAHLAFIGVAKDTGVTAFEGWPQEQAHLWYYKISGRNVIDYRILVSGVYSNHGAIPQLGKSLFIKQYSGQYYVFYPSGNSVNCVKIPTSYTDTSGAINYLNSGSDVFPDGGTVATRFAQSFTLPANHYIKSVSVQVQRVSGSQSDWNYEILLTRSLTSYSGVWFSQAAPVTGVPLGSTQTLTATLPEGWGDITPQTYYLKMVVEKPGAVSRSFHPVYSSGTNPYSSGNFWYLNSSADEESDINNWREIANSDWNFQINWTQKDTKMGEENQVLHTWTAPRPAHLDLAINNADVMLIGQGQGASGDSGLTGRTQDLQEGKVGRFSFVTGSMTQLSSGLVEIMNQDTVGFTKNTLRNLGTSWKRLETAYFANERPYIFIDNSVNWYSDKFDYSTGTGIPGDWIGLSSPTVSRISENGNVVMKVVTNLNAEGVRLNWSSVSKKKLNTKYRFKCKIKVLKGSITVTDSASSQGSHTLSSDNGSDWTTIQHEGTTGDFTNKSIDFKQNGVADAEFYIDDLHINVFAANEWDYAYPPGEKRWRLFIPINYFAAEGTNRNTDTYNRVFTDLLEFDYITDVGGYTLRGTANSFQRSFNDDNIIETETNTFNNIELSTESGSSVWSPPELAKFEIEGKSWARFMVTRDNKHFYTMQDGSGLNTGIFVFPNEPTGADFTDNTTADPDKKKLRTKITFYT